VSQVKVDAIREYTVDGASRVEAIVDGEPLWFESLDLELEPAAEAFAGAALIPALAKQRAVVVDTGLDPVWRGNVRDIVSVLAEWWDYAEAIPVSARGAGKPRRPGGGRGTAQFFSGGVDSFHALQGAPAPDLLVLIWGFDYYLEETERAAATRASLNKVAQAIGSKPVFIRTNVRRHPLFHGVSWDRTHGGVLAAIGHTLSGHVDRVRIPTGLPMDRDVPWGSHPRLDPQWSSSHFTVERAGPDLPRLQKIADIADQSLAQAHLRVCLQDSNPSGNCSRCARCMLVMIALEAAGQLRHCTAFSGQAELAERVRRLRRSRDRYATYDELQRTAHFEPELDRALRDLVKRSRWDAGPWVRWRRRFVGQIATWLGLVEPGQRMR
jgi:hypothetical protein